MTDQLDAERFQRLLVRLGGRADKSLFDELAAAYAEPHRAYHNARHINDCLQQLDAARHLVQQPDLVEAALWYHDAVYDPRAADNEERSAILAREALQKAGVSGQHLEAIESLILMTRHKATPPTGDATVLVDIDLSILGRDPQTFEEYDRGIRQEYVWVPEQDYRQGRARILSSFLERPRLFGTDDFFQRYEQPARRNLERTVQALQDD